MSGIAGALSCVRNSALDDESKDRIINEIKNTKWDSENGLRMSDADIEAVLTGKMKKEIEAHAKRVHQAEVQLSVMHALDDKLRDFANVHGEDQLDQLMHDVLTQDHMGLAYRSKITNIENRASKLMNNAWQKGAKLIENFGETGIFGFGVTKKKAQKEWVKEIFGEGGGSPEIAELAKIAAELNEEMRKIYNDAGGTLDKRASYTFPTVFNALAMKKHYKSADGFVSSMLKEIKNGNITFYDSVTGKPFSGDGLDGALRMMWENIITGRPDAPIANKVVVYPDGSTKTMSKAVSEQKIETIISNAGKPIDDVRATKLDDEIRKLEGPKKSPNKLTEKQEAKLEELKSKRSTILSTEQKTRMEVELEALKKAEDVSITGERIGDATLPMMRSHERSFVFNNADSWLKWHDQMGVEDYMSAFYANIDAMSNEIALMQTFGPDVNRGFDFMRANVLSRLTDKVETETGVKSRFLDRGSIWEGYLRVHSGEVNQGGGAGVAKMFGTLRNAATGTFLAGSTPVVALGDMATTSLAAGAAGTGRTRALMGYIKNMVSKKSPAIMELYMGAAHTINASRSVNRFTEITEVNGMSGKYAENMMRLSFITQITRSGDASFAMQMNMALARNITKSWDRLPKRWKKSVLENFGWTKEDWIEFQAVARDGLVYVDSAGKHTDKRGMFSSPYMDLAALDNGLDPARAAEFRDRLMESQEVFRQMAVLKATTQARYATTGGGRQQGDFGGYIGRLLGQFQSFPIAFHNQHLQYAKRAAMEKQNITYGLEMVVTTTMAGMVILMTDDLKKGRDPRKILGTNPEEQELAVMKYWGQAFMRAGGAGWQFDFMLALAQGQEGVGEKVMGPGLGFAATVLSSPLELAADIYKESKGEKDWNTIWAEVIVGVSDLSPTRAHIVTSTFHHMLFDYLAAMNDPAYVAEKNDRIDRVNYDKYGSDMFMRRGEAPHRMPDWGNALEEY